MTLCGQPTKGGQASMVGRFPSLFAQDVMSQMHAALRFAAAVRYSAIPGSRDRYAAVAYWEAPFKARRAYRASSSASFSSRVP